MRTRAGAERMGLPDEDADLPRAFVAEERHELSETDTSITPRPSRRARLIVPCLDASTVGAVVVIVIDVPLARRVLG